MTSLPFTPFALNFIEDQTALSISPPDKMAEPTNLFLAAARKSGKCRLEDALEHCELNSGDVVVEPGRPISYAYFPTTCVVSQLVALEDGKQVEVDTVGNEGFIGLPVALENVQTLISVVQIPGEAYRLEVDIFRQALDDDRQLDRLASRYTLAKLHQFAQSVACNALHDVKKRMCRWLLMCHDRKGSDEFSLTQKFISQMLGVRRPTVSEIAARLQFDGLINYKRGRIMIKDREGLEQQACPCYQVVKNLYEGLLDLS